MSKINDLVWGFAKALVEHAKDNFKKVSPTVYKERMETCLACPDLTPNGNRCLHCGCLMTVKAGWKSSRCADPAGPKWKAEKDG